MPDDTRALREDQRVAMETAMLEAVGASRTGNAAREGFAAGFIAGLRHRDGEPSDEEVEAAAQVMEEQDENTVYYSWKSHARDALRAARKVNDA